jgi:hypothetical protein
MTKEARMTNHKERCPGRVAMPTSRRRVLQDFAGGFGMFALAGLLDDERPRARAAELAPAPRPHFAPKAKNVIFCFMDGGVSHVDSFDPKPKLAELDGKLYADSKNPTANGNRKWLKSPWKFKQHGGSGIAVSELFPHLAGCVDDFAVIRSMKADLPLHSTGVLHLHTGANFAGRPSLGSWVSYGLGSENKNLPSFVVLSFGVIPCGGMETFSSAFLPIAHQSSQFRIEGAPVDNIKPADPNAKIQETKLAWLRKQNRAFTERSGDERAIEAAIGNYELAYRMQSLVPDVVDLARETAETHKLYGLDSKVPSQRQYGMQCLRARRLIESGVRFVEITCPPGASNGTWDQHGGLKKGHEKNALDTDQAIAGLLKDLKRRGLLDETLVVWAGEFGRTPHSAGTDGRDHHPEGFSVWLAGGGAKPGTIYGATDELGMRAVENVTSVHDLHATILHLLGLDHWKLTYRFGGRDMRLTDVHGRVIDGVIS